MEKPVLSKVKKQFEILNQSSIPIIENNIVTLTKICENEIKQD
jgi:hypothetical protein